MTATKTLLLLLVAYAIGCGAKETAQPSAGLEACRACGEFVSISAASCPKCGKPSPTATKRKADAIAAEDAEVQESIAARVELAGRLTREAELEFERGNTTRAKRLLDEADQIDATIDETALK